MKRSALLLAGLALAIATTAQAKMGVDLNASTGVFGRYVFRGTILGGVSLQSDVTLTKQFTPRLSGTAYLWTSHALAPAVGGVRWQEADYDVSLTYQATRQVSLTGGWVFYHAMHPGIDYRHTAEVYGKLDLNKWPYAPGLSLYYDHINFVGLYGDLHASRSFALGKSGWSMDTYGEVGFNFNADKMTHGLVRTGLRYDLGKGWTLKPRVDWWFPTAFADPTGNGFRPELAAQINYNTSF